MGILYSNNDQLSPIHTPLFYNNINRFSVILQNIYYPNQHSAIKNNHILQKLLFPFSKNQLYAPISQNQAIINSTSHFLQLILAIMYLTFLSNGFSNQINYYKFIDIPILQFKYMDERPIELPRLKEMIRKGIQSIPVDNTSESAILVIGDTGVGKSTIMSFLSGAQLTVRLDGLKPSLDNREGGFIKIGHQKFSETSVPTKIVLENMAFYDCPGFKDNKGEEYQISNSFFIQRLLDIYKKVKLVLIVDETHVSETRADKFPKLIKSLQKAFKTFEDIKDGVFLIINRADKDQSYQSYIRQLEKMIEMKGERNYLFDENERNFIKFLINTGKVFLFRSPSKADKDQPYIAPPEERTLMQKLKNLQYVKSKHIQNILSESARLSIRDFIDEITKKSNMKIELICSQIVNGYAARILSAGRDIEKIMEMKEEVIALAENIRSSKPEDVVGIIQKQVPPEKMQDFEQDYASVIFFKGIYDKTATYFSNLVNKIYTELTHLLHKFDKRILTIQRENAEQVEQKKKIQKQNEVKKKREAEKVVIDGHVKRMDELRLEAHNLTLSASGLREELLKTLEYMNGIKSQFVQLKEGVNHLQKFNGEIKQIFTKVETTYFTETKKGAQINRAY